MRRQVSGEIPRESGTEERNQNCEIRYYARYHGNMNDFIQLHTNSILFCLNQNVLFPLGCPDQFSLKAEWF